MPVCTRCSRSKDPRIKCTYRKDEASSTSTVALRQATRQEFIEELNALPRMRQTIACVSCRADKKACHGAPERDCDRCLARGTVGLARLEWASTSALTFVLL